jgi:acetoin utilization protein AcuB
MTTSDVMTKGVETVAATSDANAAWGLMRLKAVHHLVVKDGSKLVGVLSDRDLGSRNGQALRRGKTVVELMSRGVVTVNEEAPVRKAANLMRGRSIGSLVVTNDAGRAVGIITVADLLEFVGRGLEHPASNTARTALNHRAPHRKRHRSTGAW